MAGENPWWWLVAQALEPGRDQTKEKIYNYTKKVYWKENERGQKRLEDMEGYVTGAEWAWEGKKTYNERNHLVKSCTDDNRRFRKGKEAKRSN